MMEAIKVTRNLDGKGRLILPRDFREAAGFEPDQRLSLSIQRRKRSRNPKRIRGHRREE